MPSGRHSAEDITAYALQAVAAHPADLTQVVARRFGITRQAAHRHLAGLVTQGGLQVEGRTRGRRYSRGLELDWHRSYVVSAAPQEDLVWRQDIAPLLAPLPAHVREIWAHGITQVFSNAVTHADARRIAISLTHTGRSTRALVIDDGVGIFRKVQRHFGLVDERHARLELAKGRLTTDPARHTGRGLRLVSRLFDGLHVVSGGLHYSHQPLRAVEWLTEFDDFQAGTAVLMHLHDDAERRPFDQGEPEPTTVPVRLAREGDAALITRSEGRRLMARLEDRADVVLDFADVPRMGYVCADEIFRVWAQAHPQVQLSTTNASDDVRRLIASVTGTGPRSDI